MVAVAGSEQRLAAVSLPQALVAIVPRVVMGRSRIVLVGMNAVAVWTGEGLAVVVRIAVAVWIVVDLEEDFLTAVDHAEDFQVDTVLDPL